MKTVFLLMLVCIPSFIFSQAGISSILLKELESKNDEFINVNIFFHNNEDINELNDKLNKTKAGFDERVKKVSSLQKSNSEYSFNLFIKNLENSGIKNNTFIKNLQPYWVVNMINADIKKEYIYELVRFDNVKYIDLNSPRYKSDDVVKSDNLKSKAVNSAEPGLYAINAHKLWELGYSGKNILFLSVDTGVIPQHPAISDNYAGNYWPMDQCWLGIRNDFPTDNSGSSHGTHTTGTVLGLDRNTNDTIGVAFNAKWIATDPVASTDDELLNPLELFSLFQWALDPDGDPDTTDDVPRVINNSWGFDYNVANKFGICDILEAEILITLEAAGICSPFSAGNNGPRISTIGFPALLAYNPVNPMSIGALNSDMSIANFSSRGPSICEVEEGQLKIKPEVSAPGVNVRSCVGQDGYNYLSGTSMACPHVAGALLLLIEAFPDASAYELKNSLYQTSIDLGEEGEDNIFGRGMIDVFAAYEFLSGSYTPTPPVSDNYDLNTEIIYPNNIIACFDNGNALNANFKVKNSGREAINGFNLKVFSNDVMIMDSVYTPTITPDEELLFNINNHFQPGSINNIYITAKPLDDITEYDRFNNSDIVNFHMIGIEQYPLYTEFNNVDDIFNDLGFIIINPDYSKTWEILPWGENNEHKALGLNFRDYNSRYKEEDFLYIPKISLPDSDSIFLNFTYAYKNISTYSYNDSIFIDVSTDCGNSYPYNLFRSGGINLATVPGNANSFFKPASIYDFDTVSIALNDFRGQDVIIRLKAKNDKGSVVYFDKITIGEKFNETNVPNYHNDSDGLKIYPNPAHDIIYIEIPDHIKNDVLKIYNLNGQLIKDINVKSGIETIDCKNMTPGTYMIKLNSSGIGSRLIIE